MDTTDPLVDLPPAEVFAHCLTDEGLARLRSLLDSGRYEVRAPEEAALLVVAWLLRAGEADAAAGLVEELRPHAHEVRFAPRPAGLPSPGPELVHRRTVGEAAALLERRGPDAAVEAQREALTVWRPYEDELLAHWRREDAHGPQWTADGALLLERYRSLAAAHTRCTGHLDPKSNAAVLRGALEEAVAGRAPSPRAAGLLRHAVDSMTTKREKARPPYLERPGHHELAALVRRRLSAHPVDRGLPEDAVAALVGPVTAEESRESGLPAGTVIPPAVREIAAGVLDAPVEVLLERGTIPSAEVLAELAPRLIATYDARGYADAPLRTLIGAVHRASRSRYRSHWSHAYHAPASELPWVRAVERWHRDGPAARARAALTWLTETSLAAFPGTGLPVLLVYTLSGVADRAELPTPLLTEPFANDFSGAASPRLLDAARHAAELLRGTVYERYYGVDFAALRDTAEADDREGFGRLCAERAGRPVLVPQPSHWRPRPALTTDQAVMEQARILTTCNLATLVREAGIAPGPGWAALARAAFTEATAPAATAKRTARAWRHLLFHLSLCERTEQSLVLAWIDVEAARLPARAAARIAMPLAQLRLVA
ncbi:hypothetical protein ACFCV9_14820 [Streptomyces sp. NPDC056367]|uniref:hypothetical protein n=1 Tax=Streptomyces sp. NPDC056367 TaxID=3345797 RepID=UPI0035E2C1B9